jgi:hypothetical protein
MDVGLNLGFLLLIARGFRVGVLPLGVGHIRTATHDYIRHGTVTLFAALNYLEAKSSRCWPSSTGIRSGSVS